jgi:hypothetical protein
MILNKELILVTSVQKYRHSSLNVFDDGALLLLFKFWTFSIILFIRVGAPEDEGRAIPRNVVVQKQGDDGESPKFKK